jgi:hypothetical protein
MANKIRTDHPTYNGTDSTRGLPVIEYIHEGKAKIREIAMKQSKKGELSDQMSEELKKPIEFNWPEGQIPESGVSPSVKLRLSNTFDPIRATREAFQRERAARGKKDKKE